MITLFSRLPVAVRTHLAALRALLLFTVLLGLVFPLGMVAVSRIPGLAGNADGSLVKDAGGTVVGSDLIGQPFTDADGAPLPRYFQSRPSAGGYDPLLSGASNLGPEDMLDAPDLPSLLTQVCQRSKAIGELEGVDGSRPYCTADGVGAVLAVFRAEGATGEITRVVSVNQPCPAAPFLREYRGHRVTCAEEGETFPQGVLVPVRGDAPEDSPIPPDAVTASGSGLDPHISPDYAELQVPRVAREQGMPQSEVRDLVDTYTDGRVLGFMGEPRVNVVRLNVALDDRSGQ